MTVVVLGRADDSTWIIYNALRERFEISAVIVEEAPAAVEILRRRARTLGWPTVIGQAAFIFFARLSMRLSKARLEQIFHDQALSNTPAAAVTRVESANSVAAIELLRSLRPNAVVVSGTRILSEEVLACINAPFVNLHAGITPMYRGVHGCYWALANRDSSHAGVTVHVVDRGVDTGPVIAQATVQPTRADSYNTYPTLQIATGLPLLVQAVEDAIEGQLATVEVGGESRLYYHPTIWRYLVNRVRLGVR